MAHYSIHSPVGDLTLFEENETLISLDWGWADAGCATPLLAEAQHQLDAYFDGDRRVFDLPLAPAGTPFETQVWLALLRIPYGEVRTYGAIAHEVGSAPRAVGGACGRNPLPILIPCHRVVAATGALGGYSGLDGLETKSYLLGLEGARPVQSRLQLQTVP